MGDFDEDFASSFISAVLGLEQGLNANVCFGCNPRALRARERTVRRGRVEHVRCKGVRPHAILATAPGWATETAPQMFLGGSCRKTASKELTGGKEGEKGVDLPSFHLTSPMGPESSPWETFPCTQINLTSSFFFFLHLLQQPHPKLYRVCHVIGFQVAAGAHDLRRCREPRVAEPRGPLWHQ